MKVFIHQVASNDSNQIFICAQEAWCLIFRENWDLFNDEDALDDFITEHGL